ncbi:MAG: hypothetical protein ABUL42_03575 [Terricaulis silvestris]
MQSDQFVSAVRCAAYDSLPAFAGARADIGAVRLHLNAEALRQSPETETAALRAVDEVVAQAKADDAAALRQARDAACSQNAGMIAAEPARGREA